MFGSYLILSLSILLSLPALGFRKDMSDTSTYNECLWNQEFLGSDQVDCNDLAHHYLPQFNRKKSSTTLRVGSYNILRTSEQKGKKNLDLTARMIDSEWDLVALQELQPGRKNDILASFKSGGDYSDHLPAYLQLFLKLQEQDPSWGMILSPYAQGSDAELLGFLYRAKVVQPVESEYCTEHYVDSPPYNSDFVYRAYTEKGVISSKNAQPINNRSYVLPQKAVACPLKVSPLAEEFFIKVPLMARFKSGNFESSYISLHLSFRGIDEFDSQCMGLCQLQNLKLMSAMGGEANQNILKAINQKLNSQSVKTFLDGSEIKLLDFDERCQIDDKKLKKDKGKETKRYNNCLSRFEKLLARAKKAKVHPRSCNTVVKNIDNKRKYETCIDDFEDLREEKYKALVEELFTEVVFEEVPLIKKKPRQNMTNYLTDLFSKGLTTGLFNVFGKDLMISKGEGREFARFFQVYTVMQAAQEIANTENSQDLIIAGDFNLEKSTSQGHWHTHTWDQILDLLEGAELYIEGLTSINAKRKLSNNYDHFIFSPQEVDECDTTSTYVLNFLTATLSDGFELGQAVEEEKHPFVMSDHLPIGMNCSTK